MQQKHVIKKYYHLTLDPFDKKVILSAFVLSIVVFVGLVIQVFIRQDISFDHRVIQFVNDNRTPARTSVMHFFTQIGSEWLLVPSYLIMVLWLWFVARNKVMSLYVFVISVSSLLMMLSLKWIFNRERPDESVIGMVHGNSFPSGHTYMSWTFFGILAYLIEHTKWSVTLKRCLQIICLFTAAMIGISRVYLGVHYFTDIVAGTCLAGFGLVLTVFVLYKLNIKLPLKSEN